MNVDGIVSSWSALAAQLEADIALQRWVAREPDLRVLAQITDPRGPTARGASHGVG